MSRCAKRCGSGVTASRWRSCSACRFSPSLCCPLTFSNAVIRDLSVDVVDQDNTQTSMTYVQALNSAPGVNVTRRSTDLSSAMHAIRSGEALATVYLPRDLERDIAAGKRPQIVIFYNKQYFTPGNVASAALAAAVSAGTADLPASSSSGYAPGPSGRRTIRADNPALNYAQFLLRAILPTVLHIVVAISAGYAVGSEFGSRNLGEWLEAAGGDPLTALVGKLAPYFGIFVLLMVVAGLTIHRGYEVPFRGSAVLTGAAGCLLVVAYLSLGALLQLLARNLAFGLSLTGIVCSPAFGFAGSVFRSWQWALRAGLGLVSAAALVHPDPVRSGGARRAARLFARAVCRPCRRWRWPISASRCFDCDLIARKPAPAPETVHDGPPRTRHRRRFCPRNMDASCATGRLRSVRAGAHPLWRVLPSALSRTAGSCRANRRRRQRLIRA